MAAALIHRVGCELGPLVMMVSYPVIAPPTVCMGSPKFSWCDGPGKAGVG